MKKFETIQEAADYAVLKMVEQGGRCVNSRRSCTYYNSDDGLDRYCAIGHLVCDSENLHTNSAVDEAINEFSDSVNYELIKSNLSFFTNLQIFHDSKNKTGRRFALKLLKRDIDTSKPQYKQWVEMV